MNTPNVSPVCYAADWPDRHELMYVIKMLSFAHSGFRKPVKRLALMDAASRVEKLLQVWCGVDCSRQNDVQAAEFRAACTQFFEQLQAYLSRQKQITDSFRGKPLPQRTFIPDFDEDGLLPPGTSHVTWAEFAHRFGWNEHRREQLQEFLPFVQTLRNAGCLAIEVGGRFASAAEMPNDIDCRWLLEGMALHKLPPLLRDAGTDKKAQIERKETYGIDGRADAGLKDDLLRYRSIIDRSEYDFLPEGLGALPERRPVGVVRIDLTQPLTSDAGDHLSR